MSYFNNNDNLTWAATPATTDDFTITNFTNSIAFTCTWPISDKDWMPYRHFEYDPLWHKKYAAIKYQMKTMWVD